MRQIHVLQERGKKSFFAVESKSFLGYKRFSEGIAVTLLAFFIRYIKLVNVRNLLGGFITKLNGSKDTLVVFVSTIETL